MKAVHHICFRAFKLGRGSVGFVCFSSPGEKRVRGPDEMDQSAGVVIGRMMMMMEDDGAGKGRGKGKETSGICARRKK